MSGSANNLEVAPAALPPTDPRSLPHLPNLSARELEIVRLVAKGMPNKIIADVLEISPWTVATYLRRSFGKLQVHSKAELVAKVLGTL